jgi:Asp-tRNA(Asn)/Glu-tRNA(Gln) amidotransferase A subunit family amidase
LFEAKLPEPESNMSEHSGEILLTYAELGERLGLSSDGARMKAKRENWPTERANDRRSPARVRVPRVALPEHPPERRSKHGEDGPDFENRLAELAANVAEIRAALARANDTEAELRTRAAVAEARLDAEREGARALIAQLRSELVEARRPWWRRWG